MIVLPLALGGTKLNKHIFVLAKGTQEIMFNDKLSWNQGHAHMKHLWLTTSNPSILVITPKWMDMMERCKWYQIMW